MSASDSFTSNAAADKTVRAPQAKDLPSTRRKQEGAFYTPSFITRYIVQQALGGVLQQRFEALRQQHESGKGSVRENVMFFGDACSSRCALDGC